MQSSSWSGYTHLRDLVSPWLARLSSRWLWRTLIGRFRGSCLVSSELQASGVDSFTYATIWPHSSLSFLAFGRRCDCPILHQKASFGLVQWCSFCVVLLQHWRLESQYGFRARPTHFAFRVGQVPSPALFLTSMIALWLAQGQDVPQEWQA